MAILSITENFTGLGSEAHVEPDGKILGAGSRYFDVMFDLSDLAVLRPFIARADSRIPQLGELHPYQQNNLIYVINQEAVVHNESSTLFRVTIRYREIRNPLDEPPIIEWFSAATMEPIDTDIDGKPILTSSDEPFDPPPTEEFYDLVMRATYNVSFFDPVGASNYKGAVNSDLFRGFAPGLAKVKEYRSRQIWTLIDTFYVEVTVELHFRSTGWKRKFLDQGYRTKTGEDDDGKPTYSQITDDEGNLVTEPVLLDGNGQKLADGDPVVRREYWTKKQLSFNDEFGML